MLARHAEIPKRWLVVGLTLHGLAAALVLTNVLCSSAERDRLPAEASAPAVPARHPTLAPAVSTSAPAAQREDASRGELRARATDAAEELARALENPEYEDQRWHDEVADHARTLGTEAIPALRALLADEQRSVEEHVAATELVAAIERE